MNTILMTAAKYQTGNRLRAAVAAAGLPMAPTFSVPAGEDQTFWDSVPPDYRRHYVRLANAAAAKALRVPAPSEWLAYSENGDRRPWESSFQLLNERIALSSIALALTDEQRFATVLIEALDALVALPSWCLPDHYAHPLSGVRPALPDPSRPVLDIAAAWTAGLISLVAHLAEDRLPTALRARLSSEVARRVLTPWREDPAVWHGIDAPPNNWAPWIASNIVLATGFAEANPEDRREDLTACAELLDRFLAGFGDDGACEEGPAYWWWASATCFETISALENTYSTVFLEHVRADLYAQAQFITDMHIGENRYANFGDSSSALPPQVSWTLLTHLADQTGNRTATEHARYMRSRDPLPHPGSLSNAPLRHVTSLGSQPEPSAERPAYPQFSFYPSQQLALARQTPHLGEGLTLFAKAGHNGVSHNHNDVGSFIVGVDGEPVILDLGAATYDRSTFGQHTRYLAPTTRSGWHNVPIVAGSEQLAGPERAARDLKVKASASDAFIEFEYCDCYSPAAGLSSLRRNIALVRGTIPEVRLRDTWLASQPVSLQEVFVTRHEPQIDGDTVHIGPLTARFAGTVSLGVEQLPATDVRLTNDWGPVLYRLIATTVDHRNAAFSATIIRS
ncbi:hypothetical protein QF011_003517 [Curtobacterium flaccumfaciens]|nr:heparinase II/III family protein [Curtobacterium flaccumfaciens]MDQ0540939.1 hypothetical protein [Curtobacterium flaccumfaciens]